MLRVLYSFFTVYNLKTNFFIIFLLRPICFYTTLYLCTFSMKFIPLELDVSQVLNTKCRQRYNSRRNTILFELWALLCIAVAYHSRQGKNLGLLGKHHFMMNSFLDLVLSYLQKRKIINLLSKIGQFWKLWEESSMIADTQEFVAFNSPNYARAAMNFYVH